VNSPFETVASVVEVVVGATVVVVVVVAFFAPLAAVVVVVAGGARALTEKSVPVTTVTAAPLLVGPIAMMTCPEKELATATAAGSAAALA